jgi:hypothetical protein
MRGRRTENGRGTGAGARWGEWRGRYEHIDWSLTRAREKTMSVTTRAFAVRVEVRQVRQVRQSATVRSGGVTPLTPTDRPTLRKLAVWVRRSDGHFVIWPPDSRALTARAQCSNATGTLRPARGNSSRPCRGVKRKREPSEPITAGEVTAVARRALTNTAQTYLRSHFA